MVPLSARIFFIFFFLPEYAEPAVPQHLPLYAAFLHCIRDAQLVQQLGKQHFGLRERHGREMLSMLT